MNENEEFEFALAAEKEKQSQSQPKQPVTRGLWNTSVGQNSELLQKARIPQQAAETLSKAQMDLYEPKFRSVGLNAALRVPQTMGSILSQNIANQISPESLLVGGALKGAQLAAPVVKAVGRWIGNGAEKLSGLHYDTPGVLGRTVEDPGLPFRPGVEAANATYGKFVDKAQVREGIKTALDKKDLIGQAYEAFKDGSITPDEAFIARKTLGQVKNSIPQDTFYTLRKGFDDVAKTKFAGADTARAIAEDADALRNLAPLNKNGTTSIFKTGIGLAGAGASHFSPTAALTVPAFSPAIQAGIASGVGVGAKAISPLVKNPELGVLSSIIADALRKKGKK